MARKNSYANLYLRLPNEEKLLLDVIDLDDLDSSSDSFLSDIIEADRCIVSHVDDASQNMINTGVNVSTTAGKDVLESSQHIFNLEDLSPSQDRHDNSTSSRDIICQKQQNLIPVDPRDCSTKKELTSPTDDRKKKSVTESCGSIELASKMSKSVNNNKVREMKKRKDSSSPPKCCNSKTNNYVPGLERLARSDSFMRVPIKSGSENEEILNRDCKRKNRHQKSSELKCRKNFSLGNNEECQTLKSNLPKTVEMSHVNPINKIKTEVSEVHKNISPNDRNMDSRKIHTSGIEVDIEKKTYIDKNLTSSVPKCRNKTTNYDVPRLERLVGNGTSVKVQIKFGSENQEKVTSEDKKRKNSSIERSKNSGLKHRRNSAISSNEESALLKCNSLNTGEISHMNPEKGLKAKVSEVCKNTAPNDRNMDSRKIKTSGIAVDVEKKTYIDKNLTSSVSKCRNNTTNYDVPGVERLAENGTSVKVQIKFGSENQEKVTSEDKKRKNSSIESSKNSGLKHRRNSATSSKEESASLKCSSPNTGEISYMNPEKVLKTKVSEVCKNTAPNDRNMDSRKIKTSGITTDVEKKTYIDKKRSKLIRQNSENFSNPIVKYKTNSSCLLVDAVGLRIEKSTEKCNSSAAGLQSSENNSLLNNSKKSSGVPTVKRMNSNVCAVSDTNGAKQVLIERNVIKSSSDYLISSNSTNILLKLNSRPDVRSENNDSQQHLFGNVNRNYCSSNNEIAGVTAASSESCKRVGVLPVVNASCMSEKVRQIFPAKRTKSKLSPLLDEMVTSSAGEAQIKRRRNSGMRNETPTAMNTPTKTPCESSSAISRSSPFKCLKDAAICHSAVSVSLDKSDVYKSSSKQSLQRRSYATYNCGKNINPSSMDKENSNVVSHSYTDYSAEIDSARSATTDKYSSNSDLPITSRPKSHDSFSIKKEQADEKESSFTSRISSEPDTVIISENKPVADSETGSAISPLIHSEDDDIQPFILELSLDEIKEKLGVPAKPSTLDKVYEADSTKGICYDHIGASAVKTEPVPLLSDYKSELNHDGLVMLQQIINLLELIKMSKEFFGLTGAVIEALLAEAELCKHNKTNKIFGILLEKSTLSALEMCKYLLKRRSSDTLSEVKKDNSLLSLKALDKMISIANVDIKVNIDALAETTNGLDQSQTWLFIKEFFEYKGLQFPSGDDFDSVCQRVLQKREQILDSVPAENIESYVDDKRKLILPLSSSLIGSKNATESCVLSSSSPDLKNCSKAPSAPNSDEHSKTVVNKTEYNYCDRIQSDLLPVSKVEEITAFMDKPHNPEPHQCGGSSGTNNEHSVEGVKESSSEVTPTSSRAGQTLKCIKKEELERLVANFLYFDKETQKAIKGYLKELLNTKENAEYASKHLRTINLLSS